MILSCLKFRRLSTRRFPPGSDPLLSECAETSRVARGARLGSPALPFVAIETDAPRRSWCGLRGFETAPNHGGW